jgi:lipid II:glycine glycyltransferase (peptidoglycan interpeptide bridge formation enzyme)
VELDQGHAEVLLKQFYELLVMTRRRHQLPPQPFAWFHNLAECFGNRLIIYIARLHKQPIAAILTLRHKRSVVYKYGCSDIRFHNVGGMPFLFWQAIRHAKAEQLEEFDLGRSEADAAGLIRFKDNLGAHKTCLNYWRVSSRPSRARTDVPRLRLAQRFLSHLPDGVFRLAGELFYRHAG